jgi:hypothetical protein
MLPPTIFFFVGFKPDCADDEPDSCRLFGCLASFMLATTAALVVGNSVVVANAMALLRRYDRGPLIQPILFKTVFTRRSCSLRACSSISSGSV